MGKKVSKYKQLNTELMKEITAFVIECHKEEEARNIKARYDKKKANTKLLLRNYRSLVEHCDKAIYRAAQMDEDIDLAEILEMMGESRRESIRIESIRESAARTRLIIDHVNEMLEIYRILCERSLKEEDKRRYRVIMAMYISEKATTPDDIAIDEYVDRSTVYRDVDAAIEHLTALIFGVDGLSMRKRCN